MSTAWGCGTWAATSCGWMVAVCATAREVYFPWVQTAFQVTGSHVPLWLSGAISRYLRASIIPGKPLGQVFRTPLIRARFRPHFIEPGHGGLVLTQVPGFNP